jgi:hypothetical protein
VSNYMAAAAVTAALKQLIQEAVSTIPGVDADVVLGRPQQTEPDSTPIIHLYLYMIRPNPGLSNCDLPVRNSGGDLVQKPRAVLDLYYMISFHGQEKELVPQRLMGKTICALLVRPLLTREMIQQVINSPQYPYLAGSDLDQQVESIKLMPFYLNNEDFSKLWSVFLQVPHRLFLTYQASVVIFEPQIPGKEALPVGGQGPQLYSAPANIPVIKKLVPEVVEIEKNKDTKIQLQGENLWSEKTAVLFGNHKGKVIHHTPTRLTVQLPPRLPAALNKVYIVHDSPDNPEIKLNSNEKSFILRPMLEKVEYRSSINPETGEKDQVFIVIVTPGVRTHQEVELLLNQLKPGEIHENSAYSFSFEYPPHRPALLYKFVFTVHDVRPGRYLVRLRIAGQPKAESLLVTDKSTGRYTGPSVEVT